IRTCRARSVDLLGGSRLLSLSSTRRDQYILPWLFSIRCLGPASSREPVFPSYRGTATDSGATRSRDYPMWTAPPPGTRVPWIWGLLGLPRSPDPPQQSHRNVARPGVTAALLYVRPK